MRLLGTVRSRLTVYYAGALALTAVVFSIAVYLTVRADLLRQMDQQLSRDLAAVTRATPHELDDIAEMDQQGTLGLFQVREGSRVIAESRGWARVGNRERQHVPHRAAGRREVIAGFRSSPDYALPA